MTFCQFKSLGNLCRNFGSSALHSVNGDQLLNCASIIGEDRQLVTDEPVAFEK